MVQLRFPGPEVTKFYTGVGSRETPEDVQALETRIAQALCKQGWWLRSGRAVGSDQAFERGAGDQVQLFLPRSFYKGAQQLYPIPDAAYDTVPKYHPGWPYMSEDKREQIVHLMARNAQQVLGPRLELKSAFLLCWTADGCEHHSQRTSKTGGTGQAISIASDNGVPVFNLANPESLRRVMNWLEAF